MFRLATRATIFEREGITNKVSITERVLVIRLSPLLDVTSISDNMYTSTTWIAIFSEPYPLLSLIFGGATATATPSMNIIIFGSKMFVGSF